MSGKNHSSDNNHNHHPISNKEEGEKANEAGTRYGEIADTIRQPPQHTLETLGKVMQELEKSHSAQVLMACKKYIQRRGLYLTDHGTFGLPLSFLENIYSPYDMLLYSAPDRFKSNDLILVYSYNEENIIRPFHMGVVGFSATGNVEVSYVETRRHVVIPASCIIARLLKVIAFGDPLWHELIYEMINQPDLINSLQGMVDKVSKAPEYPEKGKQLAELKRRLNLIQKQ